LGALQRYRLEYPRGPHLLTVCRFLVNYPFADRLYLGALDVIKHLKQWGKVVILSEGDVVFQPRRIERLGLFEIVGENVLVYVHKEREMDDVERRYPADHFTSVDDKLRILTAIKSIALIFLECGLADSYPWVILSAATLRKAGQGSDLRPSSTKTRPG
jgi:hypothetical protein